NSVFGRRLGGSLRLHGERPRRREDRSADKQAPTTELQATHRNDPLRGYANPSRRRQHHSMVKSVRSPAISHQFLQSGERFTVGGPTFTGKSRRTLASSSPECSTWPPEAAATPLSSS